MALNAESMASAIASAIESKANSPIFKARCFAGQDVSKEIWEVICAQIIEHIKNNIEIDIPELTVKKGIDVGYYTYDSNGQRVENRDRETISTGKTQAITLTTVK